MKDRKKEIQKWCRYYHGEERAPENYTEAQSIFWAWENQYVNHRYETQHDMWEKYADEDFHNEFPEYSFMLQGQPKPVRGMLAFSISDMFYHSPQGSDYLLEQYGHDYHSESVQGLIKKDSLQSNHKCNIVNHKLNKRPMHHNINTLKMLFDQTMSNIEFLFFWKHDEKPGQITEACLSQWYPCTFFADGIIYNCAEQYMMAEKARMFHDYETLEHILKSDNPDVIKKLGRMVKNFDSDAWDKQSQDVVRKGNLLKFTQNKQLCEFLLATGEKVLAEASPYDKIWGIGMSANEAQGKYPHLWNGENRLGFILMDVRDCLNTLSEMSSSDS